MLRPAPWRAWAVFGLLAYALLSLSYIREELEAMKNK